MSAQPSRNNNLDGFIEVVLTNYQRRRCPIYGDGAFDRVGVFLRADILGVFRVVPAQSVVGSLDVFCGR